MKFLCMAVMVIAVTLISASRCGAMPGPIGLVKTMMGVVEIIRDKHTIKAMPGILLFEGDLVRTGSDGKVGIILADDTNISMGHDSKLVLAKFMFQPKENNLSCFARFLHGTLSFITGRIAKLAPNSVRIQTPNAVIGVRGTHILVMVE